MVRQQQYWAGVDAGTTVTRYAQFEFGAVAAPQTTAAVAVLEATYAHGIGAPGSADALTMLAGAEAAMSATDRAGWRWRLLKLRATIDAAAYAERPARTVTPALRAAFAELSTMYAVGNNTLAVLRPGFPSDATRGEC